MFAALKWYKKYKAYTLAEVLITLTIVGIIASMTIPSLTQSSSDFQYKTAAKQAYSVLNQALGKMKLDGHSDLYNEYVGKTANFKEDFMQYFEVVKDCGLHDCVPLALGEDDGSEIYQTLDNGTGAGTNIFSDGQFIINNGMLIMHLDHYNADYMLISVDVNGHKKEPNVYGKDVFMFELTSDNLIKPSGAKGTKFSLYCGFSSSDINGMGCTSKALLGEDYP